MKKFFVTYGDCNYEKSLARIKDEAERSGLFDKVVVYTPEDLPPTFRKYTEIYRRGGGYWLWKPYIIADALDRADEGDIVVYADAECSIYRHKDWQKYFNKLRDCENLFFVAKGKSRKWCKRDVFDYFGGGNDLWKNARQIQATFILTRKCGGNAIIRRWCDLAAERPDLFVDVDEKDLPREDRHFHEHRHDQAVLTACVCKAERPFSYRLLPERVERKRSCGQAVLATRIGDVGAHGVNIPESRMASIVNSLTVEPFTVFMTRILFLLSRL